MSLIKMTYNYLHQKPLVGIISGVASTAALKAQQLLTDEYYLKIVSGIGAYAGAAVACLTAIVWAVKAYNVIRSQIKKSKDEKNL